MVLPVSIATRYSSTAQASPLSTSSPSPAASASGGCSATKVPPLRPLTETRCPLWTSVVSAWRRVEREIRNSPARSRSGGSRLPGTRRPRRIAVPSRSTVSSKVVGGRTGLKTASSATSRFIGQPYTRDAGPGSVVPVEALLGDFRLRVRGLLYVIDPERPLHAAGALELDPPVIDHLDVVAPGVQEVEAPARQHLEALA